MHVISIILERLATKNAFYQHEHVVNWIYRRENISSITKQTVPFE